MPTARARGGRWLLTVGASLLFSACAANQTAPPAPRDAPEADAPLQLGPLEHYLPSSGLRWLVQLRPALLLQNETFARALPTLVPPERQRAFVELSGAVPTSIDEAWFAQYQLGSLWLVDGQRVGTQVESKVRARVSSLSAARSARPDLVDFSCVAEQRPCSFLRVADHLVAWADEDPALTRVVRAYAEGKLKKAPPALASFLLEPLAEFDRKSPLRAFAAGPFDDSWTHAAPGPARWLGGLAAFALSADFENDYMRLSAHLLGGWDSADPSLPEQVRAELQAWLDAPELRALGSEARQGELMVTCEELVNGDPRTQGLALCHLQATFSMTLLTRRLQWLIAPRLGGLTGEPAAPAPKATPVAPSGSD